MKEEKEYFAFISYKSEDVEWAIWLQHELEHYRLPASFNGRTDIRQELRPVFRDIDELSAGNLPEQIKQALQNSQNLIVVCSPQAAVSHWVNKEVETFISLGRTDRIFPFIVEGNSPKEFFPSSLLALPEKEERLGGDASKQGRDVAFVKVVAGMLGLGFDSLWNRYEREKAEEERKLREQRNKLLIAQGRAVAHHAKNALLSYNSYLARRLALEVIAQNGNNDILPEIESVLRFSSNNDSSILNGHVAGVKRAIYSYDNSLIVSCSSDKTIIIWDESKGCQLCKLIGHNSYVNCVSFGKTSSTLFSGSVDGAIYQWDIQKRKHKLIIQEQSSIDCFTYLKQQDILVYYAGYGIIKFIDYKTSTIVHSINDVKGPINSLSVNSSNTILAISANDSIVLFDLNSFETTKIVSGHSKEITNISFSSDGESILSTSRDGTIKLWNIKEKKCYHHLVGHNGVVWDAKFHPSLPQVVSVSADCNLCIWNITEDTFEINPSPNTTLVFPQLHQKSIYSVSYNKDGTKLLTASLDTLVRNLSLITNENLSKYTFINCEIKCILASDDLQKIIIGDSLGRIIFLNPSNLKITKNIKIANSAINSITYDNKTNSLVVCSIADYVIRFFNLESNQVCLEIKHVCSEFCSLDNINNRLFFNDGNDIGIYSLETKNIETRLNGHTSKVNCIYYDRNNSLLYSSSADTTIRIWDMNKRDCIKVLNHNLLGTTVIAVSDNGRYLATASEDNKVVICDTSSYNIVSTLHHNGKITAIKFFKNGKTIVTSSWDKNLCIWDIESGELLNSYYHETLPKPNNYVCVETPLESIINDSWITDIDILEGCNTIYSSSILGYFYAWKYEKKELLLEKYKQQFANTSFNDEEKKSYYLI